MVKYYIYIHTDRVRGYYIDGVAKALNIYVSALTPYDKFSQKFNKYRYTINYTESPYKPDDYYLYIVDPNAWIYKYILSYYYPRKRVNSVDIFFKSNDKGNREPLIFGFNHDDQTSVYYTYYRLRSIRSPYYSIPTDGSFGPDDLLTRLLEELSIYTEKNKNKLVIMVKKKIDEDTHIRYPSSGPNKLKITLRKAKNLPYENFEKYEHSIDGSLHETSFYLCIDENTLFIDGGHGFKKLNTVDVYFDISTKNKPVFAVLNYTTDSRLYNFSSFESDLRYYRNIQTNKLPYFSDEEVKLLGPKRQLGQKEKPKQPTAHKPTGSRLVPEIKRTEKASPTPKKIEPSPPRQETVSLRTILKEGDSRSKIRDVSHTFSDKPTYFYIEKKQRYQHINVLRLVEDHPGYIEYQHSPDNVDKGTRSIIFLNDQVIHVDGEPYTHKLLSLSAYYVHNKSKEDNIPFLLCLVKYALKTYEFSNLREGQKSYYIRKHDYDNNWISINKGVSEVDQYLRKISDLGESGSDLNHIRYRAYDHFNGTTSFFVQAKAAYNDAKIDISPEHSGYTEYKHTSNHKLSLKPFIILDDHIFKVNDRPYNNSLFDVCAYYTKDKNRNEDKIPFLIVFYVPSSEKYEYDNITKGKKIYYTRSHDYQHNWRNLNMLPSDMHPKFKYIENLGKSANSLDHFRQRVYDYLNNITTFILERTSTYGHITVTDKSISNIGYAEYEHRLSSDIRTNLAILLKDQIFNSDGHPYSKKFRTLSAYFVINTKSEVDKIPFLVGILELSTESYQYSYTYQSRRTHFTHESRKIYYTRGHDHDNEWIEINGDYIYDYLRIIGEKGKKETNLDILRQKAYDYLNDTTTYKIEQKTSYGNIKISKTDELDGFLAYDHEPYNFEESIDSTVLINNQLFTDEGEAYNIKLLNLTSYFMKDQFKKEDTIPFLVVFKEHITTEDEKDNILTGKQAYYTKYEDSDTDWIQLNLEGPQQLHEKLREIDYIGKHESDFHYLRQEAYEVLNRDLDPHPKYLHDSDLLAMVGKIAGGVLSTAATVGTGVGVAYTVFPQWFLPVINALV